jgi:hypothetical protein
MLENAHSRDLAFSKLSFVFSPTETQAIDFIFFRGLPKTPVSLGGLKRESKTHSHRRKER